MSEYLIIFIIIHLTFSFYHQLLLQLRVSLLLLLQPKLFQLCVHIVQCAIFYKTMVIVLSRPQLFTSNFKCFNHTAFLMLMLLIFYKPPFHLKFLLHCQVKYNCCSNSLEKRSQRVYVYYTQLVIIDDKDRSNKWFSVVCHILCNV